ncbi:DUF2207 domain-containing protein [Aestuariimicrobium kwangyangense]|uniref:DUF2207 domain-containing protein n=1 Tax=Aestuariimicrobium kwangyangense TaxID=396389 RepID=UPI0003B6D92A|nr:DUF2207 domain-containing protein [Aestuariimicrobium kwangyangense]
MKRLIALLGALTMSVAMVVLAAPRAAADSNDTPSSWNFSSYHVTAQPKPDGTTRISVDFVFDFSRDAGHGPFLTFVSRMRVADDPDHWRVIDYSIDSVTSSTGADTTTKLTRQSDGLVLRIGRENRTFTGQQQYTVVYTAKGIVNPRAPGSGLDEFNWNAIVAGDVPFNDLQVSVQGPVATTRTACFQGRSFTVACSASPAGSSTAVFKVDRLTNGQGMQVVAGYPAGTFPGAKIQYTKRVHPGNMFPVSPAPLAGGALVALLGTVAVGTLVRRRGRDEQYIGVAPGLTPAPGASQQVGKATKQEIPVAFSPPRGATPGEVGVLVDESADNRDVTATILDLAVRGHLQIRPDPERPKNFTLALAHRPPADTVVLHEQHLLDRLFGGRLEVTNHDLADKANAKVLTLGKSELEARTVELGWFARRPSFTRAGAFVVGAVITLLGLGAAFLLGLVGWGWVGLGIALAGLVLLALHRQLPARTAAGSAVLAQALGFRTYLATAEADQIRFEEGIDVFSRYLPWATVFGVADRWVRTFQQLEAEGRYHPDTSWYGGGYFWGANLAFAQSMDAVTHAMSSSLQSAVTAANASSGSGGGSGFGGGGGVGGGSGGGW